MYNISYIYYRIDEDTTVESENISYENDRDINSTENEQHEDNVEIRNKCFFCNKVSICRKGRQIYCRTVTDKTLFLKKIKA